MPRVKQIAEEGFEEAYPSNLPKIDPLMLADYFNSDMFLSPEMRNVKTQRSARSTYSDQAIGWVRVKKTGSEVHVKADITPEHKIRDKPYEVNCIVDETKEQIVGAYCSDCSASTGGGCKHAVAFVSWLHRVSSTPSVTSTECYWKKSALASSVASKELLTAEDIKTHKFVDVPKDEVEDFVSGCMNDLKLSQSKALILLHAEEQTSLALFHLMIMFKREFAREDAALFLDFCRGKMTPPEIKRVANMSVNQATSSFWFAMRQWRVTASTLHEASVCQTDDGALVKKIKGAAKVETPAMLRGKQLEPLVRKSVEKKLSVKTTETGLVLNSDFPVFGASPDGLITETHVLEIKCPSTKETFNKYFSQDKTKPAPRYMAQIQLQMFMCNKKEGIFCVADPGFTEEVPITTELYVPYDKEFTENLLRKAEAFWVKSIFPKLYNSV